MKIEVQIKKMLDVISEGIYEKEHILAMALMSAIAGESIFLLGPPGTAKSLVARRLKLAFSNAKAFEYLMSRFSTPDEIFGPVSISLLKNEDRYERVVDGFLPTATVVFLDEIWKAGPSIQNALLTAINERVFHNGRAILPLSMKVLIAASNELPAEDEGLEALWDRFLVRMVSNCIQAESTFFKMIRQKPVRDIAMPEELQITEEIYESWQQEIHSIAIPDDVCSIVTTIRKRLKDEAAKDGNKDMDFYVSDRRWKKCFHIMQTAAFLNGRKCLFYTADYNHVDVNKVSDGILYRDDQKKAWIVHAIYTSVPFDYKVKNAQFVKKIKLQKCNGGIIIDNTPYAFERKMAFPGASDNSQELFGDDSFTEPTVADIALSSLQKKILPELEKRQKSLRIRSTFSCRPMTKR